MVLEINIYASLKQLFLFFFSAPCFWNKVFHCLPDSRHAQRLVRQNEEREILSPGNDVWGWTGAFAERKEKEWETVSPWMALVTTMLQQKYSLEIEECSYKMKSESGIGVWDLQRIYVLAGQYSCRLWWELENRCFQWRKWKALPVSGLWWAPRRIGTQECADRLKIWTLWFKKRQWIVMLFMKILTA